MVYDPSKGEISRAMRNRGVELHLTNGSLGPSDLTTLALGGLGAAVASDKASARARRSLSEKGLHGGALLSILAQEALAGGQQEKEMMGEEQMTIEHRLLWGLPDLGFLAQEADLAR